MNTGLILEFSANCFNCLLILMFSACSDYQGSILYPETHTLLLCVSMHAPNTIKSSASFSNHSPHCNKIINTTTMKLLAIAVFLMFTTTLHARIFESENILADLQDAGMVRQSVFSNHGIFTDVIHYSYLMILTKYRIRPFVVRLHA